jgi:hypothetical protein
MNNNPLKIDPFYNQPPSDSILYRYVTIDKLIDFLLEGRISLVKLNLFEDKLEGVNLEHLRLNYKSDAFAEKIKKEDSSLSHISVNINPTRRNLLRRKREIFQDTNYASCWYVNNHESVAMWQLYSKPDSVAIRIPFKNLLKELSNLNLNQHYNYEKLSYGCVDYYQFNNFENLCKVDLKNDIQGFIKDSSFEHEQEFRIIIELKEEPKYIEARGIIPDETVDEINENQNIKVIHINFSNFKNLPFEIIFHPQSTKWHRQNIKKMLDKFELTFKTSESALKDIFK